MSFALESMISLAVARVEILLAEARVEILLAITRMDRVKLSSTNTPNAELRTMRTFTTMTTLCKAEVKMKIVITRGVGLMDNNVLLTITRGTLLVDNGVLLAIERA